MCGPLALVGGDEFRPGNEPHDRILATAASGGPAFVVPTAAARQGPETAVRNAKAWFDALGLELTELPVLRKTHARSTELAELAATGRFFYLVGGDPGLVADVLRDSPVWDAMVRAWRAGAALAGSSAGAMAIGRWTLIRARRPGDHERRYRDALDLVPDVSVLPHFDTFGHRWTASARDARPSEEVVLLGIDERSAAVFLEHRWTASGPGGVTVITGDERRRFDAGDPIEGLPDPCEAGLSP